MENSAPARPAGWPRVALAVLVVALVGAAAYIYHLQGQVAQREAPPSASATAPAAPPAQAAAPSADGAVLTAQQEQALQDSLSAAPAAERKAWFQVQANNPNTGAVQAALQRAFEKAGWKTETIRGRYPLKSGIFLLAADETPPAIVDTVSGAFSAAGISIQYLTGYRAFFDDRKRNNPNWVGPELASDQPFLIVIGPQPTPKPE